MYLRRRGNQYVPETRRVPLPDCFDDETAAEISYNGIHGQNSIGKASQQVFFQPRFHRSASLPTGHQLSPGSEFLDSNCAETNFIFGEAL